MLREIILNAEKENDIKKIPLLTSFYIIPTEVLHEGSNNEYCVIRIVGVNINENYLKEIDEDTLIYVNNYGIEKLIQNNKDLKLENECLEKRLKHLLESDLIKMFDEINTRTKEYKYDISKLDKEYVFVLTFE